MNKTWERIIIQADNLGLEFEFREDYIQFFSGCEEIGILSQCKPHGWVLARKGNRLLFNSKNPRRLLEAVRDI
jgi:hypothetical protein